MQTDLDLCPVCGHEWSRHDPEDGQCDAGAPATGYSNFGPCPCGRSLTYHQQRNAELARHALMRR